MSTDQDPMSPQAEPQAPPAYREVPFVHLRVHSPYSILEGSLKKDDLLEFLKKDRMPAVGICDTNMMSGALEYSGFLKEEGIQPITGVQLNVEVHLQDDCLLDTADGRKNVPTARVMEGPFVLLPLTEKGYKNLMKLTSRAYIKEDSASQPQAVDRPRISLEDLKAFSEDCIGLSGGAFGLLGQLIAARYEKAAQQLLDCLQEIFADRLYMEIQRHGLPQEKLCEDIFIRWADGRNIPLVATNEAFFAQKSMQEATEALLCIADGTLFSSLDRRRLSPEHYLKSSEEMCRLFADLKDALANTVVIAKKCAYFPTGRKPMLPPFGEGMLDEADLLKQRAEKGLERRLQSKVMAAALFERKPYEERLRYEIEMIVGMGFSGYFLIVSDFIRWAKDNGVPVGPGRGSGAGSLVAWCLRITEVDPLAFGLLFERFLNPDRISMPDFDIDFCQEGREKVIQYVQKKYGQNRVAQIITFGQLQGKGVLRDVGRVLGLPYGQVDQLAKMLPAPPATISLAEAQKTIADFHHAVETSADVRRLVTIARQLEGLYRHVSTHAAGVVISSRDLDEIVPLYRDYRSEMPVTQFSMKYVEAAGLVKFDFLGLRTLSVLSECIRLIAAFFHKAIPLDDLPLDDKKTYEKLSLGETVGVFQMESGGMRDAIIQVKPSCIDDIVAIIALYRPGPMEHIPAYIRRKNKEENPEYLSESLKDSLESTYGIMIYQEQVMQAAQIYAGYSLAEADLLRRAMGKKIKEEMAQQKNVFIEGAVKKGHHKKEAAKVFEGIAKFADYGFNKSHAVAYGIIAYQTAYMKAHYPAALLAATMTFDMDNTDKLAAMKEELRRQGIPLYLPHVNRSGAVFLLEDDPSEKDVEGQDKHGAIRYALGAIKGIGRAFAEDIEQERKTGGLFADIQNFLERVAGSGLNKKTLEALIATGALDGLGTSRRTLWENVDRLLEWRADFIHQKDIGQSSLFAAEDKIDSFILKETAQDWGQNVKLKKEREHIGFYLSAHPLDHYEDLLAGVSFQWIRDAEDRLSSTANVSLVGVLMNITTRRSRTGNVFSRLVISDRTGLCEMLAFTGALESAKSFLEEGRLLFIDSEARIEHQAETRQIFWRVLKIQDLWSVLEKKSWQLFIELREQKALEPLAAFLEASAPGHNLRITLEVPRSREKVCFPLKNTWSLSKAFQEGLYDIEGLGRIVFRQNP